MKKILMIQALVLLAFANAATAATAQTVTRYVLTITNGSSMPISPAAVFTKPGSDASAAIGARATTGLIALCQTGNPAQRITELRADSSIKNAVQTMGPVLPGASLSIEIDVNTIQQQSIQFEAMYGKTKDACAVTSFSSHSLVALKQHSTSEVIQKDNAILTGAFTEPVMPQGMTYLDGAFCASSKDAVSCLRELSLTQPTPGKIKFFAGYLPSLVTALELKYGVADVQTLLFPSSGAVQFKLQLKH